MSRGGVAHIRRRALLVGAFILVVVIAYGALFAVVKGVVIFGEKTYASTTIHARPPLDLYLDVTAIDPVRESMDVRVDVATGPGPHGSHYGGTLDRDVELRVSDGDSEQDVRLRRNGPLPAIVFAAGLRGAVAQYPFDRYSTSLVVSAVALSSKNGGKQIPIRATVWEGVPAWVLSVTNRPSDGAGELTLAFGLRRPAPLIVFACVIYCLMVLIAISAIAISSLVFVGMRRIEVTLLGALAAMAFALPGMRNILPGTPPFGVFADIFVLLWAELLVALGLTLFVLTWVRRGPGP